MKEATRNEMTVLPEETDAPATKGSEQEWDLEALRLDQSFDTIIGAQPVIVTVGVRKPHPQEWFRVHEDNAWRLPTTILHLKEDRETYLVHPSLRAHLWEEIQPILLCTAISRQGELFLWPVRLPKNDGRTDRYAENDLATIKVAEGNWTRRYWLADANVHKILIAKELREEPPWPTDIDFQVLVKIAFKDRRIDNLDHPAVKRLRGEF